MAENRYTVQSPQQSTEKGGLALSSRSAPTWSTEQGKLLQKKLRPSFISELRVLKLLQMYFTGS